MCRAARIRPRTLEYAVAHKSGTLLRLGVSLFVESDLQQGARLAQACPVVDVVWWERYRWLRIGGAMAWTPQVPEGGVSTGRAAANAGTPFVAALVHLIAAGSMIDQWAAVAAPSLARGDANRAAYIDARVGISARECHQRGQRARRPWTRAKPNKAAGCGR